MGEISRRHFLACGAILLAGCAAKTKVEYHLASLIDDALEDISNADYKSALDALDANKHTYSQDIGFYTLLAIAQAGAHDFNKSSDSFRELVRRFEERPEVIFTVRDRLRPLFRTPEYEKMRQRLLSFAGLPVFGNPDLYVVDGFLCLAEHRFGQAYDSFAKILPKYPEKRAKYGNTMAYLKTYAKCSGDMISAEGYDHVRLLFEDRTPAP